ncbi:MAG: ABC transporter ATP-binding protein [Candidatus Caldarchaeum sp.]|nr:ABC transporter ATP-binding protein [Candidatus Caldarchaeum sp.]MCX8200897.1 ABC transporter ATP-binding protein [Candidatus Caldarchaeum sp.]MDW8063829.1 ABC transporter ATP-binding protein [Candidatus Caldarchaeum sp.]MDW8435670.1 ABC transporter ATP-binding protein [Candidatus Caldarchaeum sp.]
MLRAEKLSVAYVGDIVVLDGVSVKVEPRKVSAVIGPNGAGKSTLLKTLFGLLKPRSGEVFLDGKNITETAPHQRIRMGVFYIPQESGIFGSMTVKENLELAAWLFRNDREKVRERVEVVLSHFPRLRERLFTKAGKMSGGEQKFLELAKALMNEPKYLLVDEPTVGLSPSMADMVYDELKKLTGKDIGMLIVDQYVDRVLEIADYVYYVELGRVKAEGSVDYIRRGEFLFE